LKISLKYNLNLKKLLTTLKHFKKLKINQIEKLHGTDLFSPPYSERKFTSIELLLKKQIH
jgi:hypothetical protein